MIIAIANLGVEKLSWVFKDCIQNSVNHWKQKLARRDFQNFLKTGNRNKTHLREEQRSLLE